MLTACNNLQKTKWLPGGFRVAVLASEPPERQCIVKISQFIQSELLMQSALFVKSSFLLQSELLMQRALLVTS